ncbi:uncharacterized protein LODBEIA_P57490 [Lodderomyces beijingensis]|uniref:Transcription factor n=1 Tax=Lodderomyces beijingensis TaxID=1775926 RepID=A0ABP0ZU52_9ASCO
MSVPPSTTTSLKHTIAPNSTLATTSSSNQSGSNDFVKKLFLMLQEDSYKNIVKWTQNGDSFVVINTNNFTKDILPRHFKHSNFASFVRQLNKYDFHKVKIPNEAKSSYPYGEDAWEFKHPDFRINDRESLDNIKRKGPTTKKTGGASPSSSNNGSKPTSAAIKKNPSLSEVNVETAANDSTRVPLPQSSHPASNHNYIQLSQSQNHLREQVDALKESNQVLSQENAVLQKKYKTLVDHIVSINSFNERYYRSMSLLINVLLQSGIKIPPLDFPPPNALGPGPFTHPDPNASMSTANHLGSLSATSLPSISQHLQSQSPRIPPHLQSPVVSTQSMQPSGGASTMGMTQPIPSHLVGASQQPSQPAVLNNNRSLSIPSGRPPQTAYSATSPISGLATLSRSSSVTQANQAFLPTKSANQTLDRTQSMDDVHQGPPPRGSNSGQTLDQQPPHLHRHQQHQHQHQHQQHQHQHQHQQHHENHQQSLSSSSQTNPGTAPEDYVHASPANNKPLSPLTSSSASPKTNVLPQTSTTSIANPKFHVLLVEDDNVCIQLCRKFLVKYGCQVTVVTDGLNAISTVENTKYDLVLMDIVMPNLDGATATSVIRSFDTKTPIIAMTGNIEDNDLVTYLQNGMSDILAKPFTKDDLYSILAKHLLKDGDESEEPMNKKSRLE